MALVSFASVCPTKNGMRNVIVHCLPKRAADKAKFAITGVCEVGSDNKLYLVLRLRGKAYFLLCSTKKSKQVYIVTDVTKLHDGRCQRVDCIYLLLTRIQRTIMWVSEIKINSNDFPYYWISIFENKHPHDLLEINPMTKCIVHAITVLWCLPTPVVTWHNWLLI